MTYVKKAYRFRQSCIAMSVSLLLAQSAYALQDLSDTALSETTGEGVALLPENFKMVFQGPNDVSKASSYGTLTDKASLLEASRKDTGFIRIIPRGENYENLYKRAYDKIYKDNYQPNYTYAKENLYQPSYDSTYTSTYNSIYQNGSTTSSTYQTKYAQVAGKNKVLYRNQEVGNYVNTQEYQDYYKKRKNDYLLNAHAFVPKDGTTVYDGGFWNDDKASENAFKNTVEKIEKEKGTTITNTVNSKLKDTTLAEIRADATVLAKNKALSVANLTVENYAISSSRAVANTSASSVVTGTRNKADVFIYGLAL
ncbi:MAG: hypothetical protein KAY26_03390, partial [Acinetobacter sp.]|nr:hypothetical protein [Acinetobacter sp.]